MNEINTEILISRIRSLADEKGLSLTAVFVESGAGKNFKSNLKTAKPTLGKLTLIANYLNTTVEYLLGETDVKEKPVADDELSKNNVKFIGRNGTVIYKRVSPEFIKILESIPDTDEDL